MMSGYTCGAGAAVVVENIETPLRELVRIAPATRFQMMLADMITCVNRDHRCDFGSQCALLVEDAAKTDR